VNAIQPSGVGFSCDWHRREKFKEKGRGLAQEKVKSPWPPRSKKVRYQRQVVGDGRNRDKI